MDTIPNNWMSEELGVKKMIDVLSFATAINSRFKKDGDEFVREMYGFEKTLKDHKYITVECYEKELLKRKRVYTNLLEYYEPKTIAIFCHGSKNQIFGIGFNKWNINQLARHISKFTDNIQIILYACSCGKGIGNQYPIGKVPNKAGIAMLLANELAELGIEFKIIAHTTKGHTTKNPNCVIIEKKINLDADNSIHKKFIVPRVTKRQAKKDPIGRKRWLTWIKMLHENRNFRFRFPFMTINQIHTILDDVS